MKSFEIQVQERDCGDFHSLVGAKVDVEAVRKNPADPKSPWVWTPGAPLQRGVAQRILKNPDAEKPSGEWNVMEVLAVGQTAAGLPGLTLKDQKGIEQAVLQAGTRTLLVLYCWAEFKTCISLTHLVMA